MMVALGVKPVIVHVLDRLSVGGMETVAVSLIERSSDRYDHHVICLRGWDEGRLHDRLWACGVVVGSVDKQPGKDVMAYVRLHKLLRGLKPDIVHSYNVGAVDAALCARFAGVRHVVHAEHGRDASDPQGRNRKYRWLRRALAPFVSVFVPVSADLARWLESDVGIRKKKIRLIYNGIDMNLYGGCDGERGVLPTNFAPPGCVVIGSVGRLDPVKAYDVLLDAFAKVVAIRREQFGAVDVRLMVVGAGAQGVALAAQARNLGVEAFVWLAGERDDVPQLLTVMDMYVCSSIAEGMALTILEAMASGLPVIATDVGGNSELVLANETGSLVSAADAANLTQAIIRGLAAPETLAAQGLAGRDRAQSLFSVEAMIASYCTLYDELTGAAPAVAEAR